MFKINWNEFLQQNTIAKRNVDNVTRMRILSFTNDGKTCVLRDLENNRDAYIDIVNVLACVRNNSLYLTNPSKLKEKIGKIGIKVV